MQKSFSSLEEFYDDAVVHQNHYELKPKIDFRDR